MSPVETVIEEFRDGSAGRWRVLTDQVMGGISEGAAQVQDCDGQRCLRLTGTVSTANNGGFVQARLELATRWPATARGVLLTVRGNGERYFCHLRSTATRRPWQHYRAGFASHADWRAVALPFNAFSAAGGALPVPVPPAEVTSVALVAYGRDHEADVSLARIALY